MFAIGLVSFLVDKSLYLPRECCLHASKQFSLRLSSFGGNWALATIWDAEIVHRRTRLSVLGASLPTDLYFGCSTTHRSPLWVHHFPPVSILGASTGLIFGSIITMHQFPFWVHHFLPVSLNFGHITIHSSLFWVQHYPPVPISLGGGCIMQDCSRRCFSAGMCKWEGLWGHTPY